MDIFENLYLLKKTQKLSKPQQKLYRFLTLSGKEAAFLPLKELATQAGVSEVSVLNFCETLGYQSFIEMREAPREYLRSACPAGLSEVLTGNESLPLDFSQREKIYSFSRDVSRQEANMLQSLDLNKLHEAACAVLHARQVIILGSDVSKIAADYLQARLAYMRPVQSFKIEDSRLVSILSGLTKEDVVIIYSFLPYYPAEKEVDYVLSRGCKLIVISEGCDSPAVREEGMNFICQARTDHYFNAYSVPMYFSELFGCYIASLLGERFTEIINEINNVRLYLGRIQKEKKHAPEEFLD